MIDFYKSVKKLLSQKDRPIVFICGLGGSGKTTFAKNIAQEIEVPSVAVHSDWWATYPTEVRKERITEALASQDSKRIEQEENPQNWYSWDTLISDVKQLQSTGSLSLSNAWNQETGEKDLDVDLMLPEKGLILFEGIYLLHPEITSLADYSVMLDVHYDICRKRSEDRDSHRNAPEDLAYKASLVEKYDVPYFEKYKENADLLLSP